MASRDEAFSQYYQQRAATMRRSAYLLCGDWHFAEDLVQTAYIKLYRAWPRVERHGSLDQYVRRIVVRTFLDDRRRGWRREHPTEATPDTPVADVAIEDRLLLSEALGCLAPRQRATLVLRFWEDLSIAETADLLGVSTGTVKSHTARGLEMLRARLGDRFSIMAGE